MYIYIYVYTYIYIYIVVAQCETGGVSAAGQGTPNSSASFLSVVMGSASAMAWPAVRGCSKSSKSLPPANVLSPKKWIWSKSDSGR